MIPGEVLTRDDLRLDGISLISGQGEDSMAFESCPIAAKLNELILSHEAYSWLLWFDDLNPTEQALIAIWELEQEVYNGGFLQYFQNSSGDRVPFICEILRTIEAHQVIPILKRAIALAGPNIPWDDQMRRYPMLNSLPDEAKSELSHLDREFYNRLDDLNFLLFQYLLKHRDEIDAPEEFWVEGEHQ